MQFYQRQHQLLATRHVMTRLASDFSSVVSGYPLKNPKKELVALSHFYQQDYGPFMP